MPSSDLPRLLLVEDDLAQLALLSKFLRREQFDVVTCQGLEAAIDLAEREIFAVAVVDLDLDGKSGLEFAKALAVKMAKTRVIIHTAYSSFESVRDGLNLGVFAYVEKLSDFSQLVEHVHRAATAFLNDHLNDAKGEILLQLRLLEAVEQGIIATDLSGRIIFWNQYAETLTGALRSQAIGKPLIEFVNLAPSTVKRVLNCIAKGNLWQGECNARSIPERTGDEAAPSCGLKLIPIRLVLSPIHNARGILVGAVGSFRDITVEKTHEQQLANRAKLLAIAAQLGRSAIKIEERNQFLELVIQKLGVGFPLDFGRVMMQVPMQDRLVAIATCGSLGMVRAELLAIDPVAPSAKTVVVIKDRNSTWIPYQELESDQRAAKIFGFRAPFSQDERVTGYIEGYFWEGRVISDDEFDFVQSVASLVTGVLQRERANQLWQSLFDNSLEAVLIADDHGRYVNMNKAACEMLGYTKKDLSEKSLAELIAKDPTLRVLQNEEAQQPGTFRSEVEISRKDQTKIIAEIGTIKSIVPGVNISMLRDVTGRRHSDHIISEQSDQLSHVQRLATMGNLAAFLAHEINQPLGTISLLTGGLMLSRDLAVAEKPELKQALELINREALKAGSIVNRLRKFITLNSYAPSWVNVNEVIGETILVLKNYYGSTQTTIRTDLTPDLPSIMADSIRLEQVLVNLLRNSIEAMSENDVWKRYIDIETRTDGDSIQIVIKDNGPKLEDAEFEKLLTPYYSTKAEGLGMGLCISRSIVEQHGGTLVMHRLSPNGIQGIITLPVGQQA